MPTIAECIDLLNKTGGLVCDECHETTKIVSKALSGTKLEECDSGTLASLVSDIEKTANEQNDKVYRVDVKDLGHSFAIVLCKNKFVIMQSWVQSYTLQDWLLGTKKELEKNPFLPSKGESDYQIITTYLNTMSKDLNNRQTKNVQNYAQELFNPLNVRTKTLEMSITRASGNPMTAKWNAQPINF